MSELRLAHGLRFEDLYDPAGLARIDGLFVDHLRASDEGLAGRLMAARAEPASLDAKAESALIIAAAAHVDDFLGELFGIKDELGALRRQHTDLAPLYSVKRLFVQRRALKAHNEAAVAALDADAIRAELTPLIGGKFDELSFATHVDTWLKNEANHARELGPRHQVCRLGDPDAGGQGAAPQRRAVQGAAQGRPDAPGASGIGDAARHPDPEAGRRQAARAAKPST